LAVTDERVLANVHIQLRITLIGSIQQAYKAAKSYVVITNTV